MDSAGLSDERASRAVVERNARDRRGHRSRGGTVRTGAVHGRPAGALPEPATADRPFGEPDRATAAADVADRRQADYFLRLLSQNRRVLEHRIEGYYRAIASAEVNGNIEGAYGLRRTARAEEQERDTLNALIGKLHRRFPVRPIAEVPGAPRRSQLVVR